LGRLAHHIRVSYGEGRKQPKIIIPRIIQELIIDYTKTWVFFDGVCQGILGTCGVRVIIYLDNEN